MGCRRDRWPDRALLVARRDSIPTPAAVRTFARFMARVAPETVRDAVNRVEHRAGQLAGRNAQTIQDIADGKFEDADVARTRLAAARERLKVVGIGADKQTRVSVATSGPTAIAFGRSLGG